MEKDTLDATFLFEIDVFKEQLVFNVLIRGADYGAPARSPLTRCLKFLYISVYLGKHFIFRQMCAISVSRAAGFNSVAVLNLCGNYVSLFVYNSLPCVIYKIGRYNFKLSLLKDIV